MSRHVKNISGRLSLREPQRKSLEILHRVMELADPHKSADVKAALSAVSSQFPTVQDFERAFPSLCFALATGVGKTRLMGAFIAYLNLEHGIRHFFVLAPNLTIYNKLMEDFTPNTPKYVFQGIAEFAVTRPAIITADNYEYRHQVIGSTAQEGVEINIFNIAKFNVKANSARKMRRLSEFLGESYFEYLAGLEDLVLIMDEAHRYRADTSMKSLEDLKPILGLELTATPQVEKGKKSGRFKNIIFEYPLANAMVDGYVKEPAVATRLNFDPSTMTPEGLERLKLEDGIRIHEDAKVELEVYAQQNGRPKVKPFMLVVATDTAHADALVGTIEDDSFFDGRYKGRVIQVHSGQKGAEKDANIARLLDVERPDEPTEIVVHVNMLKEGWDVTNLYTIVPLRAADSRTLVEQSIGRGLRLPYGKRTRVPAVDRLTIVAHDRFQDIIDEARKNGYSFNKITIGNDVPETPKKTVFVAPVVETVLGVTPAARGPETGFGVSEEIAPAALILEAVRKASLDVTQVPGPEALQTAEVRKQLIAAVNEKSTSGQLSMYPVLADKELSSAIDDVVSAYVAHTIAIPSIIVLPIGMVSAGFDNFTLDFSTWDFKPVSEKILVQHLSEEKTRVEIETAEGGHAEHRLEDYVVRGLIEFSDVSYDDQADLLYDLAGQVVAHLRSDLKDEGRLRNVLRFHQRQISNLVHAQMQSHAREEASGYEVVINHGFSEVRTQAFAAPATESVRPFDTPLKKKSDIPKMLFGEFSKCLYPIQKFQSDPERRFAVVLEDDSTVLKWFKPGKGVFQIGYNGDSDYEPDFVVETKTEKLLCEPKRADEMKDSIVLAKAAAAATWCEHASGHENQHGGKPWRYLLIPHDVIKDNMTLGGLAKRYTVAAPKDDE